MIHWDWVWTVVIGLSLWTVVYTIATMITEPTRTERMKAEAALLEQKRLNKAAKVTTVG